MTPSDVSVTRSAAVPSAVPASASARLGVGLLLASDAMFFIALIAGFLVLLRGERALFIEMARTVPLPKSIAMIAFVLLATVCISIARGRGRPNRFRFLLFGVICGCVAVALQASIYINLLARQTIVAIEVGKPAAVYTGIPIGHAEDRVALLGQRAELDTRNINLHRPLPEALHWTPGQYEIPTSTISQQISDGPWRNVYFAGYFLLSASLLLHILAATGITAWAVIQVARGDANELLNATTACWRYLSVTAIVVHVLLLWPGGW